MTATLEQKAMAALYEMRVNQKQTAYEYAQKAVNAFRGQPWINDQDAEVELHDTSPIRFEYQRHMIIAQQDIGYTWTFFYARQCTICGWVKAGSVYSLESLGERLETTQDEWQAEHNRNAHDSTGSTFTELIAKFNEEYTAYIAGLDDLYNAEKALATIETEIDVSFSTDLLSGKIEGKNEALRLAAHQSMYPAPYTERDEARETRDETKHLVNILRIAIERDRVLLRIAEMANKIAYQEPDL